MRSFGWRMEIKVVRMVVTDDEDNNFIGSAYLIL